MGEVPPAASGLDKGEKSCMFLSGMKRITIINRTERENRYAHASFVIRALVFSLAVCVTLLLASSCTEQEPEMISDTEFALGTTCTVQLYGEKQRKHIAPVFELIEDVENKMSVRKDGSEAKRINEMAGEKPVEVSDETFTVIEKAKEYSALSGGTFDVTIEPLVELWSIGSEEQRVPSEEEIEEALKRVDYRKLRLDRQDSSVFLEEVGMGIDLGGIAKGYAADISVDYLEKQGVDYGIINFGGNVYAFGEKHNSETWRIGIQAPDENRGSYVGIAEITDKAVVTSGKYERYFVQDGVRYHHILSTKDGHPVRNSLASVTVITDRSLDADALSTLLFTLGLEGGMKRAEELEGVEAIFLTEEKIVYSTEGLRKKFTISEDGYKRGEAKSILAE